MIPTYVLCALFILAGFWGLDFVLKIKDLRIAVTVGFVGALAGLWGFGALCRFLESIGVIAAM